MIHNTTRRRCSLVGGFPSCETPFRLADPDKTLPMISNIRALRIGMDMLAMVVVQAIAVGAVKYFVSVDSHAVTPWGGARGDYWLAGWFAQVGLVVMGSVAVYRAAGGKAGGRRWLDHAWGLICLMFSLATWIVLFLAVRN